SEWLTWFERLSTFLMTKLGQNVIRIEHVGSTTIPGTDAKPIIDIDIVIRWLDFDRIKSNLEKIGYVHLGDLGITGREVFDLRDLELKRQLPNHHLYVCDQHSEELHRHIAFRDYLREHPAVANEYSNIKMHLVEMYSGNRERYIQGKDILVREILEKALQWVKDRTPSLP
ncbi:MAG: hypothetical protein AM326_04395, partial [Candidatus Thorarchaeota archaeon SMTZ-45]